MKPQHTICVAIDGEAAAGKSAVTLSNRRGPTGKRGSWVKAAVGPVFQYKFFPKSDVIISHGPGVKMDMFLIDMD